MILALEHQSTLRCDIMCSLLWSGSNRTTFSHACFLGFCFSVISVESPHMQAVVKEYVELSFHQLPSIMEFLCGLITQEGPVMVYTH